MALCVAFAGAASASTGTAAGSAGTGHATTAGTPNGTRSGLPWASGVYLDTDTPAAAAAFAAWRGRRLDVVEDWSARATWNDIVNPAWMYRRWRGQPYTMAFGVAMLPDGVRGVSIRACARGAYNYHWRQFGTVIRSYGLGHSIIRLGWEFNGAWVFWKATEPATWAQCWRQIVTSARSTAPDLQWDWNVNRGVSSALTDPVLAYPGNAYVNMIGIDSYDWWPPATTGAGWQTQLNGKQGLDYWLAFATRHGKKLAVPEWGNVSQRTSAGGDDPAYVWDMESFFRAHASHLAFEANFQGSDSNGGYRARTRVPRAAAAYRAGF
jgi:Glycosyl hydrolase family 26